MKARAIKETVNRFHERNQVLDLDKEYPIFDYNGYSFKIKADDVCEDHIDFYCLTKECSHLGGGDWEIIGE